MAEIKNGTRKPGPAPQEAIVRRVVLSPEGAPVRETALVLSDEVLAQLVIRAALPAAAGE
jgi:hypothetical protein